MTKKFYKTTITVEVLSEYEPYGFNSFSDLEYDIENGECSGKVISNEHQELTPVEAAKALKYQGSDPEFFMLDENGNELED